MRDRGSSNDRRWRMIARHAPAHVSELSGEAVDSIRFGQVSLSSIPALIPCRKKCVSVIGTQQPRIAPERGGGGKIARAHS